MQEEDFAHRLGLRHVLLPQPMDLNRIRPHRAFRPDQGAKGGAGKDAAAGDADGCDAHDLVDPGIEAGGLAVERHRLVGALGLEQEAVARVREPGALDEVTNPVEHQNSPRW